MNCLEHEAMLIIIIFLLSGKASELLIQLRVGKANLESAKQELMEYKDKATRILQVIIHTNSQSTKKKPQGYYRYNLGQIRSHVILNTDFYVRM